MKRKRDDDNESGLRIKSPKIYTNNQSPFDLKSLQEVKKDGNIIILNVKDKTFFYNIDGLYDYVFTFYNFQDPFTRENFTYEQLDFIRYKAYKKGLINGIITYQNKIVKTPKSSYSHSLSKFFYIERIVSNMKENLDLYIKIQYTFERFFLCNEKLDYFDGRYMEFPLMICKKYKYKSLTDNSLKEMRNVNRFKYNALDPVSLRPILTFNREDIIKLQIHRRSSENDFKKVWLNFSIEDLFQDIFDNFNFKSLDIEHLDYICFEYYNLLHRKHDYVLNSPYGLEWSGFTFKTHGKYYKYLSISRINVFLTLLDYKDNIYVDHMNIHLQKFWRNFYHKKKGVFEPLLYIPWSINMEL
jgi:hypothetical protein